MEALYLALQSTKSAKFPVELITINQCSAIEFNSKRSAMTSPGFPRGRVRVIRVLGEGSGRKSELCQDISTGRILVLKTTFLTDPLSESQKNLIYNPSFPVFVRPLTDTEIDFSTPNEMRIALPYFVNGSLVDAVTAAVKKDDRWNPTRKAMIAFGLALGLKFLHAKDVIVGFLKPSNVLLTNDFDIRITDFWNGFCSKQVQSKSLGEWGCFIAPEVRDGKFSRLSDVYSYGMILLSLLTDRVKFPADFVVDDFMPLWFPRHIRGLVRRCMSSTLSERPSLSEFIDLFAKNVEIFPGTDEVEFDAYRKRLMACFDAEIAKDCCVRAPLAWLISDKDINEMYKGEGEKDNRYAVFLSAIHRRDGIGCTVNKKHAAKLFQSAATKGVPEAQLHHGILISIKPKNGQIRAQSAAWIKQAADAGNAEAQYRYGMLLSQGSGVPVDKVLASQYLMRALAQDNLNATMAYAEMLMKGELGKPDEDAAMKYYKKASDLGNPMTQLMYAMYLVRTQRGSPHEIFDYMRRSFLGGVGHALLGFMRVLDHPKVDKPLRTAVAYTCKLALATGNTAAQMIYVDLVIKKQVTVTDDEYIKCCGIAADNGNTDAMQEYADILAAGERVPRKIYAASTYYQKLADTGDNKAQYQYGSFIMEHIPEISPHISTSVRERAVKYFKKAADAGHVPSMFKCGMLMYEGIRSAATAPAAFRYFDEGAKHGDIEALRMKGCLMIQGCGCVPDVAKGTELVKEAADKGSVLAKDHYALLIRQKNPKEALRIFESNTTVSDSIYEAAYMYDKGIGTSPDPVKAFEYFFQAAQMDLVPAVHEVGRRYFYGLGCEKDTEEAIIYLKKAADVGFPWSARLLVKVLESEQGGCPHWQEMLAKYKQLTADQAEGDLLDRFGSPINLQSPALTYERCHFPMLPSPRHLGPPFPLDGGIV